MKNSIRVQSTKFWPFSFSGPPLPKHGSTSSFEFLWKSFPQMCSNHLRLDLFIYLPFTRTMKTTKKNMASVTKQLWSDGEEPYKYPKSCYIRQKTELIRREAKSEFREKVAAQEKLAISWRGVCSCLLEGAGRIYTSKERGGRAFEELKAASVELLNRQARRVPEESHI